MSPILSKLYHDGYLNEARAVEQTKVFEAATLFAKTETILPAEPGILSRHPGGH